MPDPRPGQPITASLFASIFRLLLQCVVGGRGIAIRNLGGKMMIECTLPDVRGRRGGGVDEYEAANLADLSAALAAGDIGEWAFCRTLAPPAVFRVIDGELVEYPNARWVSYSGS